LVLSQEIQSKSTHASSLRGSVNRRGVWHTFDYYLTLRNAYRYQSVKDFDVLRKDLIAILENMEFQKKYHYSLPLISQIKDTTKKRLEEIYMTSSDLADEKFKNNLLMDDIFWVSLQSEWGKGTGYKKRVATQTESWFFDKDYKLVEGIMSKSINNSWNKFLNELEGLFLEK